MCISSHRHLSCSTKPLHVSFSTCKVNKISEYGVNLNKECLWTCIESIRKLRGISLRLMHSSHFGSQDFAGKDSWPNQFIRFRSTGSKGLDWNQTMSKVTNIRKKRKALEVNPPVSRANFQMQIFKNIKGCNQSKNNKCRGISFNIISGYPGTLTHHGGNGGGSSSNERACSWIARGTSLKWLESAWSNLRKSTSIFHYLSNRFQGDNALSIVCRFLLLTVLFILNRLWLRTARFKNRSVSCRTATMRWRLRSPSGLHHTSVIDYSDLDACGSTVDS